MGFFDTLKSKFNSGKIKREQIERLREIIGTALLDGELTEAELGYINSVYFDSQLNAEEFQRIKSEAFMNVVESAIADRRVTPHEASALDQLAANLDVSPEVLRFAEQKAQYFVLFAQIESGAALPVGNPSGLILKKDESAHLSLPATLVEERVISRQYVGSSRGISVPIVKGIRFNVGQQRGQYLSTSGIVPVSEGYFVITNKRLVFSGNRKSVASDFAKLLDFQVYSDVLQFSVTNRQKPTTLKFFRPEEIELCGMIISRILNEQY